MKKKNLAAELFKVLGLDWLVLLWDKPTFNTNPPPSPTAEIKQKLGSLTGDKLEEALKYSDELLKEEDQRLATIESKAFTLIGITGIATAFITGFGALLLDRAKIGSGLPAIVATIVYIVIVFSLIVTIIFALKVVKIGEYRFSHPDPGEILKLADDSIEEFRKERTFSLYCSYVTNSGLVNIKGTFLKGAQIWFRNSMVMLLVLTFVLAFYAQFNFPASSATSMGVADITPTTPATVVLSATVVPTPTP